MSFGFHRFSVSFLGNALLLYIGNLAGDIYLNFFIINVVMLPALVATEFFLKRYVTVVRVVGFLWLDS